MLKYINIYTYIFPNINHKARMSALTSPIPHYSLSLSQFGKARGEKKKKSTLIGMKEIKLLPATEDMTIRKY